MTKRLLAIITLTLALAGCEPMLKVTTDYDRDANFASYKTYTFSAEALQLPLDDLNRRRILDAIDAKMATKGFSKAAEAGDLLVDVKVLAKERKEAYANTTGGYGAGYPYRWGGGFSTTSINVETYVDGTLIIDFIDIAKRQLIWQGRGTKTLDPDASSEQRDARIKEAVSKILDKYPPAPKK